MKSYVINLDEDKEKWAAVRKNLQRVGLEPERISGLIYDGKTETEETKLLEAGRPAWSPRLSHAACGAFASHLLAVKTFLSSSCDPSCIIFEDDVDPLASDTEQFEKELQWTLENAPSDWEGISLHSDFAVPGACPEGQWSGGLCGSSAAYVLNRAGAQRILEEPWKITDVYKQLPWRRFYVRPTNMFVTDESTSRTAVAGSRSILHRLSQNVSGREWGIRGEKSADYNFRFQIASLWGHGIYLYHIAIFLLLLALLCTRGKARYVLMLLLVLFIPW